jgi:hypothetical protein
MTARLALSAAPPSAITLWTDNLDLYIELPGPDSAPVVLRYPLTSTGLAQALGIIRTRKFDCAAGPVQHTPAPSPNRAHTSAQIENARAVLRRMGLRV